MKPGRNDDVLLELSQQWNHLNIIKIFKTMSFQGFIDNYCPTVGGDWGTETLQPYINAG